jgi:chromosome segregation ATPase
VTQLRASEAKIKLEMARLLPEVEELRRRDATSTTNELGRLKKKMAADAARDRGIKGKMAALQADAARDKKELTALRTVESTLTTNLAQLRAEVTEKAGAAVSFEARIPNMNDEALR